MAQPKFVAQCRRWLAGLLAVMIGLGPLATPGYAALTLLADQPLNVQNQAKPNIMLTVDDSTSMLYDFLPDSAILKYCRDATGNMNAACGRVDANIDLTLIGHGKYQTPGYIFEQFGFPFPSYSAAFDTSGPGAGCDTTTLATSTCSGGVDPGPLPGLERYPGPPAPLKSPLAGKPYEYWTLWPAPVHNTELNHAYYNPRLDYQPPIQADGTSYPQMNAANTVNWTKVPADPWATTIKYVDLTQLVTVGLWCNSDWSQGLENDPRYCRTNGVGTTATTSSAASADGDYSYPWSPPGIDPTTGSSTALSIAYAKVNASHAPLPAWSNSSWTTNGPAKDPKYFYQNDNVIWCDSTSPLWPAYGPLQTQTCTDPAPITANQTCQGFTPQTCGGGTSQTCLGQTPQTCSAHGQTCDNLTAQTCNAQPQTCGNPQPQQCVNPGPQTCDIPPGQSCVGAIDDSCGAITPQTCDGATSQFCNNIVPQSCNNVQSQTCDPVGETCNLPDPSTCPVKWNLPQCPCAGAECAACALVPDCPPGVCSLSGGQCQSQGDCPGVRQCSANHNLCSISADCAPLPGTCSIKGNACLTTAECPNLGQCSTVGNSCQSNTDCPLLPGSCSTVHNACNSAADCTSAGHCTSSGAVCTSDANCPDTQGHCSVVPVGCMTASDCTSAGRCSLVHNICQTGNDCPTQPGQCAVTLGPCLDDTQCLNAGHCTLTNAVCTSDINCPIQPGVCNLDAHACTLASDCASVGHCSTTSSSCHADSECSIVPGICSSSHDPCTGTCPTLPGHCSVQIGVSCTVDANCGPVGQQCTSDHNACSTNLDCQTLPGTCSIQTTLSCTSDAQCLPQVTPGKCSIDHNSCTSDAACLPVPSPSATAVCSDLVAGSSATIVSVPNGNFESPFVGNYQYGPAGGNWTFSGGSGLQHYGGAFGAFASGDGSQTAFIQNLGSFSQSIAMNAGSYRISFLAARRGGQVQPIVVSVDGIALGAPVIPTDDSQFNTVTFGFSIATSGAHTVTFSGTDGSGDKSSFIDLVSITSGMSLLEDANGAGLVCRHNNKAYGALTADRYNFPDSRFNTPVTAGTGPNTCTASPRYASVPRHYYKTGVEWCDKQIATAGDKWLGYGTAAGGSCQDSSDSTHIYPRFYQFGQDPATDNYSTPAFQRIDLDITKSATATYTHTWTDDSGDVQTVSRNFGGATPDVSEMTNYANWFAYYRTRIQAVKTTTSISFNELDVKYRVGFHNLFKLTSFVNISDFSAAQKAIWFSQLFGVQIPLGQETPSLDAVVRIGEYYKNGSHPQLAGSTDPIVLACQKNWHMFFTDGYTNQSGLPSITYGDQDDVIPTLPVPVTGLTPGQPWPAPFREDALGTASNSLSDYTTYYWVTDLRTSGPQATNTVPTSNRDPASWQHQNFAGLSLGTSGKLSAGNQSVTEGQLTAGSLQWPKPVPSVNKPDNSGVDDLWHAAINGRGRFVNAQSADELKLGIGQVLADILNQSGARSGVGFRSRNLGASANFIYSVGFEPGWGGSLAKLQVDPATALVVAQAWEAATQLDAQLQVVVGVKDTPWFTERKIVTMNEAGTAAVPFLWANLGTKQRDSLAPGKPAARGQMILEFLRGNRGREGTKLNQLRTRTTALGDFVDSSAVYVGAPSAPYRDSDDPGYSTFKSTFASRAVRLYAGANDGMLHAFDEATGNETWAYIPSVLFRGGTAGGDPKTGLGALAYQDGALPPFKHHFYVDETPAIADVNFAAQTNGQDWRTLLVGGLGKGGAAYYALDVTSPAGITSEASAASKVLWEFKSTDLGYTYDKPLITKTRAFGGAWLVVVSSGYNNPSGVGQLYFIRASDGVLLKTMSTGAGTAGSPSGLGHPSGYTKDFHNQLAEQIYAGDLRGGFWRFDVSDANDANWTVGQMATLVDDAGVAQPVTTAPQIEIDISNGIDRWVFVGTGKMYDDSDLSNTQVQTLYALRDGTADTPWPIATNFTPPVSRSTTGMLPLVHDVAHEFGLSSKPDKGWFDDLPVGQRIVVNPQAELSEVAYIGTSAQSDPCLTGMAANLYVRNYATGASQLESGGGTLIESQFIPEGGVGLELVKVTTAAGSPPEIRIVVTTSVPKSIVVVKPKPPPFVSQHRMSWRLLGE